MTLVVFWSLLTFWKKITNFDESSWTWALLNMCPVNAFIISWGYHIRPDQSTRASVAPYLTSYFTIVHTRLYNLFKVGLGMPKTYAVSHCSYVIVFNVAFIISLVVWIKRSNSLLFHWLLSLQFTGYRGDFLIIVLFSVLQNHTHSHI